MPLFWSDGLQGPLDLLAHFTVALRGYIRDQKKRSMYIFFLNKLFFRQTVCRVKAAGSLAFRLVSAEVIARVVFLKSVQISRISH